MSEFAPLRLGGGPAPLDRVRQFRGRANAWWLELDGRTKAALQTTVLLLAVFAAYNYSLSTLWQLAGLNTPLSYISLVPVISLGLAAVHCRPMKPEPAIHDRQADYIVGLPLILAALAINFAMPARLSAMFWVWRIDLLTLPFFVAGAVSIIFGLRVLWRQKWAVLFLFLAWPYLYESELLRLLNFFTAATIFAINHVLDVLPVARPVSSLDNTLYVVNHGGHSFPLSIVSACSGVNSVVGFLLVGVAFSIIVKGPRYLKAAWLLGGMLLLWVINVARIIFIFWAGHSWGENVAINILHPFIGLLMFVAGVAAMVFCIKPLGMHIAVGMAPTPEPSVPTPSPESGEPVPPRGRGPGAVPKVFAAVGLVLVAALLLGLSNLGLKSYNLVTTVSGAPKVASYIESPISPVGWEARHQATFNWAKPLFGDASTWNRYMLYPRVGGDLHAQTDVVADVVNTPDLESFSAFGIEQCYQFHGYTLADVSQVKLPGGITGQSMAYTSQQYGSWSIVYWILPVKTGLTTAYERVVLYVQNKTGIVPQATQSEFGKITNLAGSLSPTDPKSVALIENRAFLVAYATELIHAQVAHSPAVESYLAHHHSTSVQS